MTVERVSIRRAHDVRKRECIPNVSIKTVCNETVFCVDGQIEGEHVAKRFEAH